MSVVASIVFIVALICAFGACAKALWHAFFMLQGIRPSAHAWVNLVPFMAFALPGALDAQGTMHRARFVAWLCVTAVLAAIAAVTQWLAQ